MSIEEQVAGLLNRRMPKPGERWRIKRRPVEWECPKCHGQIPIADPDDGLVVEIQAYSGVMRDGYCKGLFPMPEGWVAFRGINLVLCTLPYTLLEPIEEGAES